jgi:adenosylcobinamide-GDP ribazoletransferase
VAFLTTIGGAAAADSRMLSWFPLVGALIGGAVGGVWLGGSQVFSPLPAAALTVAADLALTGMLHVDGLADTADGLLAHLSRERRLAVMAEPAIGAYGVVAVATVVLVRFAALVAAPPSVPLIAGLWCASRTVMAVTVRTMRYAQPAGGLASTMLGGSWWLVAVYGLAAALALGALGAGVRGVVAVAVCLAAAGGVVLVGRRRLGGFTGDVLGAAGLLGETAGLLAAAARW